MDLKHKKTWFTFQRAVGGNNHHCCVPLCTARGRFNTTLSFHSFPKELNLRAQWLVKIRREGFTPTTNSRVCSRHFEHEEIVISSSGKPCLRPKTVPSLFGWNNYTKKPQQPGVWERRPRAIQALDRAPEDDSTVDMVTEVDENTLSLVVLSWLRHPWWKTTITQPALLSWSTGWNLRTCQGRSRSSQGSSSHIIWRDLGCSGLPHHLMTFVTIPGKKSEISHHHIWCIFFSLFCK